MKIIQEFRYFSFQSFQRVLLQSALALILGGSIFYGLQYTFEKKGTRFDFEQITLETTQGQRLTSSEAKALSKQNKETLTSSLSTISKIDQDGQEELEYLSYLSSKASSFRGEYDAVLNDGILLSYTVISVVVALYAVLSLRKGQQSKDASSLYLVYDYVVQGILFQGIALGYSIYIKTQSNFTTLQSQSTFMTQTYPLMYSIVQVISLVYLLSACERMYRYPRKERKSIFYIAQGYLCMTLSVLILQLFITFVL